MNRKLKIAAVIIIVAILLLLIGAKAGSEAKEKEITNKIQNSECLQTKTFTCPSGEKYLFCDRYEILMEGIK